MSTNNVPNDTGGNAAATIAGRVGNYRWVICALLFFCTTINYIDRNSLSVLKTTLQGALGWTDVDYGMDHHAFTFAYAMFPSLIGIVRRQVRCEEGARRRADPVVARRGGARPGGDGASGFVIVRFVLGFAEAANFPASIKAVGMWFPQKERALATGIFNSGTSVGVMVSFGIVWIAGTLGLADRRSCPSASSGSIWLYFWQKYLRRPRTPGAPRQGRSSTTSGPACRPPRRPSRCRGPTLLRYREIWPFLIGKFITDPVWWFYLFWLPSYLERERGQNPLNAAPVGRR